MKKITLAFDFSTTRGQVAFFEEEDCIFSQSWKRLGSHAELVSSAIENGLKASELTLDQIDTLSAVVGPGSFTGIRVTVNVVRTLAYHLNKKVKLFRSLDLIAQNAPPTKSPLLVLMNAYGNEFFISVYNNTTKGWVPNGEPKKVDATQLSKMLKKKLACAGDGFEIARNLLEKKHFDRLNQIATDEMPSLQKLHILDTLKLYQTKEWIEIKPLYLKESAAEEKTRRGV